MNVNWQGKLSTCRVLDGRARMALLWATATSFLPSSVALRCVLAGRGKHADRLLSDLRGTAVDDPSAADRLIRKFLAASSKSAALHALSSFLSLSSPFAPPVSTRSLFLPHFPSRLRRNDSGLIVFCSSTSGSAKPVGSAGSRSSRPASSLCSRSKDALPRLKP